MKKNDKMEKRQKRSVTRYIYSAAGEKLRVTYLTAVPNITVPIGSTRELAPSEILAADSTDYLLGGTLTMRNGRIDKYQFDEGYCQAEKYANNPVQDTFKFYYFDRDHLGSVRQVIEAEGTDQGTIVQKMNYYPSGLQFCNNVTDSDVQPRRYNGKEYDKMHGLNTYDYGARQYNPVTARWDRMDPLCEKYYSISPYAYCGGDPVNAVDPDGKEGVKYVDEDGNKHIEANVVVLLKKHKEIKESFSEKKKARIRKKNERIDRYNASRVEMVKKALDEIYGGKDGVMNSHGEKVYFTFNVTGVETNKPRLRDRNTAIDIGIQYGLSANTPNRIAGAKGHGIALAVVFSQASSLGNLGMANGPLGRVNDMVNFPTTLSHEFGHTFGLKDHERGDYGRGGLMDYPAGVLIEREVDEIWENAFERE
jgi:RHS repeat-associated protein